MTVTINITNTHHLSFDHLKRYGVGSIFVETGTYRGDGIKQALDFGFQKVYSCDINQELLEYSRARFVGDGRVQIMDMDSCDFLDALIGDVVYPGGYFQNDRVTFWLDAHRSGPLPGGKNGDCPLVPELNIIGKSQRKDHTIFIDNKALFGSAEWGGVTLKETIDAIYRINPDYKIIELDGVFKDDIVCAHMV